MNKKLKFTLPLLVAVGANYIAQVPYYYHQYYAKRHLMPSWPGTVLLLLTLVWFIVGYLLFIKNKRFGRGILISYLSVQVLFYSHAILFGIINGGGAVAQLKTHSSFLFVIFLIGYINWAAALYYLIYLVKTSKKSKDTLGFRLKRD